MNEPPTAELKVAELKDLELKILVERAVRPVKASVARKRRMRDDLLSHLLSIYQEEARLGDHERALREAQRRFGNPAETSAELQRSVSSWDAVRRLLERARPEPNESLLHLAAKHLMLCCAAFAAMFLLAMPLLVARRGFSELLLAGHVLLVVAIVTAALCSAFVYLADRIGRARFGDAHQRSQRACVKYCAVGLAILPGMILAIYAGLGLAAPSAASLLLAVLFAPLMPLLLLLISRQANEESRDEAEWAALELDA